mmetsp:Transcript_33494/g.70421  ORF Transcript_33494/g.70421 Transcript_33494/m.70421 type:complete len:81 (+) Transcript_33494:163-405(+)
MHMPPPFSQQELKKKGGVLKKHQLDAVRYPISGPTPKLPPKPQTPNSRACSRWNLSKKFFFTWPHRRLHRIDRTIIYFVG